MKCRNQWECSRQRQLTWNMYGIEHIMLPINFFCSLLRNIRDESCSSCRNSALLSPCSAFRRLVEGLESSSPATTTSKELCMMKKCKKYSIHLQILLSSSKLTIILWTPVNIKKAVFLLAPISTVAVAAAVTISITVAAAGGLISAAEIPPPISQLLQFVSTESGNDGRGVVDDLLGRLRRVLLEVGNVSRAFPRPLSEAEIPTCDDNRHVLSQACQTEHEVVGSSRQISKFTVKYNFMKELRTI